MEAFLFKFAILRYAFVADLKPRWMSLVSIFEPNTWMVFSVITILNGCTWFFLGVLLPEKKAHKILSTCLLNSWAVFLGVSTNHRPQLAPLQIFFIMIALYGLNVTTIYTSKLITVFTNPAYEEQIDTIQEILNSGLPYGSYNFISIYCRFWIKLVSRLINEPYIYRWTRRISRLV